MTHGSYNTYLSTRAIGEKKKKKKSLTAATFKNEAVIIVERIVS